MPWAHTESWNHDLCGFIKTLVGLRQTHEALRGEGATVVFVAVDHRPVGVILDPLRGLFGMPLPRNDL